MRMKDELNDEQLEKVVGGIFIEAISKAIDIEPAWAKVPESIKTAIKNAYITVGPKAARSLAEKLLGKYPDSKNCWRCYRISSISCFQKIIRYKQQWNINRMI